MDKWGECFSPDESLQVQCSLLLFLFCRISNIEVILSMNSDEDGAVKKKSLVMLSSDDDSLDETFYGDKVTGQVNNPIQKHLDDQNSVEEEPAPLVSSTVQNDPVTVIKEDSGPTQDSILSKWESVA